MTDSFGTTDDNSQGTNEGQNFGQKAGDETTGATDNQGIATEDLEALRRRDENAQALIPTLQGENDDLRNRLAEAENKLTSATTIDEAMARIADNSNQDQATGLDQNAVTQIVEQALIQKQTQVASDSNWTTVQNKLTETYGDWKTADTKVQERAQELDIPLQDASTMARNNPKAFLTLFMPTGSTNTDSSASVRSGGSGQTVAGVINTSAETTRDAAYYAKLRREHPSVYWKTETQLQLRRDDPYSKT